MYLANRLSADEVEAEMKDQALDIVISYEDSISVAEELIVGAYQVTVAFSECLSELDKERQRLTTKLQGTLSKNRFLRRKDFSALMTRILSDSDRERKQIEEEQKQVEGTLREYLNEQKRLAASLREKLVDFTRGNVDKGGVEAIVAEIKRIYQDRGEQTLSLLRNFQRSLEVFRKQQEEINRKLQRLVDRGESLRIEDLRQLEAARACQERKAERELRREEVGRLLARFRQQLNDGSHSRRGQSRSGKGGSTWQSL